MSAGLKHQKYELGYLRANSVVRVTLSTGANVRLMSANDYASFLQRQPHKYYGGLARRSPIRLPVPSDGRWVLTIDLGGLAASSVTASVTVEP